MVEEEGSHTVEVIQEDVRATGAEEEEEEGMEEVHRRRFVLDVDGSVPTCRVARCVGASEERSTPAAKVRLHAAV